MVSNYDIQDLRRFINLGEAMLKNETISVEDYQKWYRNIKFLSTHFDSAFQMKIFQDENKSFNADSIFKNATTVKKIEKEPDYKFFIEGKLTIMKNKLSEIEEEKY